MPVRAVLALLLLLISLAGIAAQIGALSKARREYSIAKTLNIATIRTFMGGLVRLRYIMVALLVGTASVACASLLTILAPRSTAMAVFSWLWVVIYLGCVIAVTISGFLAARGK